MRTVQPDVIELAPSRELSERELARAWQAWANNRKDAEAANKAERVSRRKLLSALLALRDRMGDQGLASMIMRTIPVRHAMASRLVQAARFAEHAGLLDVASWVRVGTERGEEIEDWYEDERAEDRFAGSGLPKIANMAVAWRACASRSPRIKPLGDDWVRSAREIRSLPSVRSLQKALHGHPLVGIDAADENVPAEVRLQALRSLLRAYSGHSDEAKRALEKLDAAIDGNCNVSICLSGSWMHSCYPPVSESE